MPPVPKKKHSRARKGGRAAHHAIGLPTLVHCPRCNVRIPPHRVCLECGYYKGRTIKGNWPNAAVFEEGGSEN